MNAFILRNYNSNLHGFTPGDKLMVLREVTLDANGQALINLGDIHISPHSKIYFTLLGSTASTGRITTEMKWGTAQMDQGSWDIPISVTKYTTDTPDVIVPAANETVMVMLIIDPADTVSEHTS